MKNKLNVVVADDVKVLADNMKSLIAKNPLVENVWTAYDGEEVMSQIIKLNPDIVFTDMQMPKKTGLEVIQEIYKDFSLRKKPKFILVTADRDNQLIVKSRKLGFDIIYKPINQEKIDEYINIYITVELDNNEEIKIIQKIEEKKKVSKIEVFLNNLFRDKIK